MRLHIWRRLRRSPIPALSVLLFAMILSVTLCVLHKANDAEVKKYNETWHTIPVQFGVTNLSATNSENLNIPWTFADVFTGEGDLAKYVTNLERVCRHAITGGYEGYMLEGITSTVPVSALWPENGTYILWREGYAESIFGSGEPLCIVPDAMPVLTDDETGETYIELDFAYWYTEPVQEHTCRFTVAGTYRGGDGKTIYCPFRVCEQIYAALNEPLYVQSIRATLASNDLLEELREVSMKWFAEPNPLGKEAPWGKLGYMHYPYALDIHDDLLMRASATLQRSIATNRICTTIVLCLSAGAGLLIGILMVRSRKREIMLMRTMGTTETAIYISFTIEQMLCFLLGILLGGTYNAWQPPGQLAVMAVTFFLGLTAALLIFLRKRLMTTIKEDE